MAVKCSSTQFNTLPCVQHVVGHPSISGTDGAFWHGESQSLAGALQRQHSAKIAARMAKLAGPVHVGLLASELTLRRAPTTEDGSRAAWRYHGRSPEGPTPRDRHGSPSRIQQFTVNTIPKPRRSTNVKRSHGSAFLHNDPLV